MFSKLKYYGLLLTILLSLFSCKHQAGDKEHLEIKPYQNFTKYSNGIILLEPVTVYFLVTDNYFPNAIKLIDFPVRHLAIDTLNQLEVKSIVANLGEERITKRAVSDEESGNLSIPTLLSIRFDNDIFDNTDYYYTNGLRLALYTKLAKLSPLDKLLIKQKNSITLSGFSFTQNMYTPTVPETEYIPYGDHPFSGFLTIGQFSESYNLEKKLVVKSRIELGVLGPASLSGAVQASVHEKAPVGWQYQISNSPVINYDVSIEKGFVSNNCFEWNGMASAQLGTLFDNVQVGTYLRVGRFVPVIKGPDLFSDNSKRKKLQYWFFVSGNLSLVGYNATLQGGIFNDKSPYTIASSEINRIVAGASAGVALYYGNLGLELENIYNSPEFKGAYDFRYGRISLLFGF